MPLSFLRRRQQNASPQGQSPHGAGLEVRSAQTFRQVSEPVIKRLRSIKRSQSLKRFIPKILDDSSQRVLPEQEDMRLPSSGSITAATESKTDAFYPIILPNLTPEPASGNFRVPRKAVAKIFPENDASDPRADEDSETEATSTYRHSTALSRFSEPSRSETSGSSSPSAVFSFRSSLASSCTLASNPPGVVEELIRNSFDVANAPSEAVNNYKRRRLSWSSSRTNVHSIGAESLLRRSIEGPPAENGLLREAISPSPLSHGVTNPEIRFPTSSVGPDHVERGLKDLVLHDTRPTLRPAISIPSMISEGTDTSHQMLESQSPGGLLTPRSPKPQNDLESRASDQTKPPSIFSQDNVEPSTRGATPYDDDADEDVDEAGSEMSEETDLSFLAAFNATSLHPDLLPQVLELRHHVMDLVEPRIIEWMRSCGSGDEQQAPSSGNQSSSGAGRADNLAGGNGQSRKRGRGSSDGDSSNGGNQDGDDDPKRPKIVPRAEDKAPKGPPVACPFVKRYPEKHWPKVCVTGFFDVSRLKEHIYRKHTLQPHCKRCFTEFKSEVELGVHAQTEPPCTRRSSPPSTMVDRITQETRSRIKSRKGIQKQSEQDKWNGVYGILFPGVAYPDDPFVDSWTSFRKTPEEVAQVREQSGQLLQKELRNIPNLDPEIIPLLLRSVDSVLNHVIGGSSTLEAVAEVLAPEEKVSKVSQPEALPQVQQDLDLGTMGTQFDTPVKEYPAIQEQSPPQPPVLPTQQPLQQPQQYQYPSQYSYQQGYQVPYQQMYLEQQQQPQMTADWQPGYINPVLLDTSNDLNVMNFPGSNGAYPGWQNPPGNGGFQ